MIVVTTPLVAERYGDRIRAAAPGVELASISAEPGPWQEGEVAYFSEDFWTDPANRDHRVRLFTLPELRWFHSFSAGTDNPAFRALLERGVLVTNSSGASSPAIAQYVLGMMLRVAKRMDDWSKAQAERRWQSIPTQELTRKTVGVVGLGSIGGEVARLAKAFGMHVMGIRRSQRPARHVDTLVPPGRLLEMLAASDFVVLAVPLTPRTELLIGEAELRAMRQDAWLINIARGRVVDEPALVRALREGWIAGACLDVFWEEPLPPEHELWSLPNAIVTPHNSGWSSLNMERGVEIFLDNLGRYAAGRRLRNLVRLDS
jgi:phosphoglycerate dehydrogenase-like enzyme